MPARKRSNDRRRNLIGSNWSAAEPVDREKHFRVVGLRKIEGDDGPREQVELEAVLSRNRVVVPREELDDRTKWLPDWR
jgi:tryptophan-rich hypothetical protein